MAIAVALSIDGEIWWEAPEDYTERLVATDDTVKLAELARELRAKLQMAHEHAYDVLYVAEGVKVDAEETGVCGD
jgi:hypothetical protein